MSRVFAAALAALTACAVVPCAEAQTSSEPPVSPAPSVNELPPVEVAQPKRTPPARPKAQAPQARATRPVQPAAVPSEAVAAPGGSTGVPGVVVTPTTRTGALTEPTLAEAEAAINQTPGGVEIVPGSAYQESTPAKTPKDILDFVPGVFVQTKWGEDSRLSIRGSGLSRNFHLRSVQLFMNGIPMNTSDGYGDFQEIDPSVYKYVEVFKGANALQYGANSLGGAINFVVPTGYDSDLFGVRTDFGSFDFAKVSVQSGAAGKRADYFIATTWQEEEGFRNHSAGDSTRGTANVGYKLANNAETRFYINASEIRQQIPGRGDEGGCPNQPEAGGLHQCHQRLAAQYRLGPYRQQDGDKACA